MITFILLTAWALCSAFVIASFADSIIKEDDIIKRTKKVLGAGFFSPILLFVLIVMNFIDNNTNKNKFDGTR
jgi:Na+/proline symporter